MSAELFKSMYAGLEDLDNGVTSSDSIFALTYMGGEGFMDTVKKGAQSAVKWVKNLVKSLMEWVRKFFGKFGREKIVVSEDKKDKYLSTITEVKGFISSITDNNMETFKVDTGKIFTALDKIIAGVNKGSDISGPVEDARAAMIGLSAKMDTVSKSLKEDDEEKAKAAGKVISAVGRAMAVLRKATEKLSSGFVYSKSLQSAIDKGDKNRVRAAALAEVDDSRTKPEDLNEVLSHLENDHAEMFAEYKEDSMAGPLAPKADWSPDVYYTQSAYYVMNGSKKRLNHLRDIRNYLHENKVSGF